MDQAGDVKWKLTIYGLIIAYSNVYVMYHSEHELENGVTPINLTNMWGFVTIEITLTDGGTTTGIDRQLYKFLSLVSRRRYSESLGPLFPLFQLLRIYHFLNGPLPINLMLCWLNISKPRCSCL